MFNSIISEIESAAKVLSITTQVVNLMNNLKINPSVDGEIKNVDSALQQIEAIIPDLLSALNVLVADLESILKLVENNDQIKVQIANIEQNLGVALDIQKFPLVQNILARLHSLKL